MTRRLAHLAADTLAATSLSIASGFALTRIAGLPPSAGVGAAILVGLAALAVLSRIPVPARQWGFAPAPLDFDPEELVLDLPVEPSARVVRLFGTLPTPGELHQRIERHLQADERPGADATDELREAIAQIGRALR